MLLRDFKKIVYERLNAYYEKSNRNLNLSYHNPGTLLYPNVLLYVETKDHFLFELLGFKEKYEGLSKKYHPMNSTEEYLYQFKSDNDIKGKALLTLAGENHRFSSLKISRKSHELNLENRFGFTSRLGSQLVMKDETEGPLLELRSDFKSCYFNNVLIINNKDEAFRVKDILAMGIISKSHNKMKFINELDQLLNLKPNSTNDLFGIYFSQSKDISKLLLAGQFANTFLIPNLRETSIGEFVKRNPEIITESLKKESFLYEEDFYWIEGNPDVSEKFINPDLMLRNLDGSYDICDLKTPKLDKKTLTKGGHKRRRFYDYVEEGIAQLANYEDYFLFEKNKEWAILNHDVRVKDPILYLIVGNFENLTETDIKEASRRLNKQYRIIDFDTLHSLYLSSD
ncbi:hypothetical protein ACTHQ4_02395 [Alkalicoccobacillus gibsonii]|uniref:hypothetical protein n=1 Tax=Alkalicoccobacillus gibsonii TaxID=79881 RepID=UPI003F7B8F9C